MSGIREFFCLHKKFLLYNLILRNLKIKYRRSVLGFLWTLLIPVSQAGIYYLVFQKILQVQIENYIPFILSGVLFWGFFANTLTESMENLLLNYELITKIPIPLQAFAWVSSITHWINLVFALPVVFAVMLLNGIPIKLVNGLVLLYAGEILLIAFALGLIFSLIMVFFRDLRYVLNLGLQLLMYGTPILYHERMVPESYQWVLWLNPVGLIFPGIHTVLLEGTIPAPHLIWVPLAWTLALMVIAKTWLSTAIRRGVVEWL